MAGCEVPGGPVSRGLLKVGGALRFYNELYECTAVRGNQMFGHYLMNRKMGHQKTIIKKMLQVGWLGRVNLLGKASNPGQSVKDSANQVGYLSGRSESWNPQADSLKSRPSSSFRGNR